VKVIRLCWLGIAAEEYDPMVRFLRDVMELEVRFDEPTTTELSLPSGDRVQVFAPGDPTFELFAEQASGPVALFEVDDIHAAHRELVAGGIEIVGDVERDRNWEWLNFRAPDGNLYELASRISSET
jgi:catechol 2,3-dioxygenase-like lactoylglutathione lyase family enzyme